jgi:hypothetical protein
MNQQSVAGELNLLEIAPESFTHLHCAALLQKLRLQFHGQQIFHEPDFLTHLSALKLDAS